MKRELLIDSALDTTRVAVIEDGTLVELHIERKGAIKQTESLFFGKVQSIKPSVCAAFVDIGQAQNAFLPLQKDHSLRVGDFIIVQGEASQPVLTKGLRVTDRVNLAGKWLVLIPNGKGVRISKKIKDQTHRERLQRIGEEICPPDCAVIVRTASSDMTPELMSEEAKSLYGLWLQLLQKTSGMTKPGLLHECPSLGLRVVRDMSGGGLSRIVVNDISLFDTLLDEQNSGKIPHETAIELFDEREKQLLLFDAFGIESEIVKALKKRVWLPCGGYLVIDPCEAMTVIDVNSGKMTLERDEEEVALRVNLEAATEVARQLRLRDIGGIIVVDFIDMRLQEHRTALLKHMREVLSHDRMPTTAGELTRLGLMELTRKRKNEELRRVMRTSCTHCSGTGDMLSAEEIALRALREVRRKALSGQRGPFVIRCSNACMQALMRHQNPLDIPVYALNAYGHYSESFSIEQLGIGCEPQQGSTPLPERMDV